MIDPFQRIKSDLIRLEARGEIKATPGEIQTTVNLIKTLRVGRCFLLNKTLREVRVLVCDMILASRTGEYTTKDLLDKYVRPLG